MVMLAVIAVVLMLTVSGLIRGEPPATACQSATAVAAANHGRVQRCAAVGAEVRLTIVVPAGMKGLGVATARSRAGPGPSEP